VLTKTSPWCRETSEEDVMFSTGGPVFFQVWSKGMMRAEAGIKQTEGGEGRREGGRAGGMEATNKKGTSGACAASTLS